MRPRRPASISHHLRLLLVVGQLVALVGLLAGGVSPVIHDLLFHGGDSAHSESASHHEDDGSGAADRDVCLFCVGVHGPVFDGPSAIAKLSAAASECFSRLPIPCGEGWAFSGWSNQRPIRGPPILELA